MSRLGISQKLFIGFLLVSVVTAAQSTSVGVQETESAAELAGMSQELSRLVSRFRAEPFLDCWCPAGRILSDPGGRISAMRVASR
jgi:hypothetical protein